MKRLTIIVALVVLTFAGVAALGWLLCPSASERANAIPLADIQRQAKSYETGKQMAKAAKELAATPPGSVAREEKLNALIDLLDPDTKAYVSALPKESQIEALTARLKEENDAKEKQAARRKARERLCWCLTFGNY